MMKELVDIYGYKPLTSIEERLLKQAAREVLLAQSSDWAFIMKTQTMVDYAVRRTKNHIRRFHKFYHMLKTGQYDEAYLAEVEFRDNIFPNIDWTSFV
jgi:1,4-alpha-glucan branching enzyme